MKPTYQHTEVIHNLNAPRAVVPILMNIVRPKSILDVGCGIGTWLKAFEEQGIDDYLGIDSHFVNKDLLKIPVGKFKELDLRASWKLERKFDLVLSLEVAEHLPESSADLFVEALTSHGDAIVFSAAIPGQGGQNHINEQWTEYWQEKFLKHGFYFHDTIRPLIWEDDRIDWWYRQNIFFLRKEPSTQKSLRFLHPEFVKAVQQRNDEQLGEIIEGKQGLLLGVRIFLNSISFRFKTIFTKGKS